MDQEEEEGKSSSAFGFDIEEDEALSLSDLPVISTRDKNHEESINKSPEETEEFEFRTWGTTGLCVADEIFFKGRILPLRPSISSSCTGVFAPSRSSSSSSRSSSCISRSHSSSSSSGQILAAPRAHVHAVSNNNFYAHPSPSPQLRRANNAGRRSTGSAPVGWSVFRLGVVQAPEKIEIHNLRARRVANVESSSSIGSRSFRELCFNSSTVVKTKSSSVNDQTNGTKMAEEKKSPLNKFFGLGFACKCSPDSVEKNEQKMMKNKKKKKKKSSSKVLDSRSEGIKRGESVRQRRIFEWLEELNVARMMVS